MDCDDVDTDSCESQLESLGAIASPACRNASRSDLPSVHALLKVAALTTQGVDDTLMGGTTVLMQGTRILGCACVELHGRLGLLRSVAVTPELRGKHWGHELVSNRIEWARTRGLRALVLFTETAASFFEKLGFEHVDRDQLPAEIQASFEFGFCPVTSRTMRLDLKRTAP